MSTISLILTDVTLDNGQSVVRLDIKHDLVLTQDTVNLPPTQAMFAALSLIDAFNMKLNPVEVLTDEDGSSEPEQIALDVE